MLNQADIALANNEKNIPGLKLLLNPIGFATQIKQQWPQLELKKIEPISIRYQPGQQCVATFKLSTASSIIRLYAIAHKKGTVANLKGAATKRYVSGDDGLSARILSEEDVVVYAYPNDRQFKILSQLVCADFQYDFLRSLFPRQPQLWSGKIEVIRYTPEHRLTCRVSLNGQAQASLKFYPSEEYEYIKDQSEELAAQTDEHYSPRLIAQNEQYHVLAYEWLNGTPLTQFLTQETPHSATAVERAAQALKQLHNQSILGIYGLRSREYEIETIEAQADKLTQLNPGLETLATELVHTLKEQLENYPETRAVTHGQFIGKHILISNTDTHIIDQDELSIGDSNADLGSFIAQLEREALKEKIQEERVNQLKTIFLQTYGKKAHHQRVEIYTAMSLFMQADEPFSERHPQWLEQSTKILQQATDIITRANTSIEDETPTAVQAF